MVGYFYCTHTCSCTLNDNKNCQFFDIGDIIFNKGFVIELSVPHVLTDHKLTFQFCI